MGKVGPMQLLIILIIALLIFGPSKLPELGKALGKTIRGFKTAMNEPEDDELNRGDSRES